MTKAPTGMTRIARRTGRPVTTPRPNHEPDRNATQEAQRLLNQGAGYLRSGRAQEAIGVLRRAYQLAPDSVPILLNLGGAYILSGRHAEAIPPLEQARVLEPENAMVWTNLGAARLGNPILASDDQQRQAIAAFEQAIELDPQAPSVHYNLGLIFRDRGELDRALWAFRSALQVNPLDRDARFWLSRLQAPQEGGEPGES